MKICVLVQNLYTLGGIQRVVTTILNELVNDENYDITVVMPFKMSGEKLFKIDERIKLKNQEELSVNREHKPVRYIFALNKRIGFLDNGIALPFVLNNRIAPQEKEKYIKYFNEENFDVVIGAGIEYSLLLGEIKKDISAKTIGWQHSTYGSYFEKRGATGYGLMKYVKKCYSALDGIWVLTNSDKTEFDNNLGIESKVLYNPLPKNDSVSTTYEEGYVLFAGRLEREHKGLDYLIDVIKKISEEVPKLRVTIIGDGPSHNWLKAEIERTGLGEKVNLLGTTDNVYQFYGRASVMVQTSRWEGFGMTILEAMSCGIAKEYGCGAKVFNRLLHLHGIQYRANGQWVLYSEHHGKGYTSSLTFRLQRSDGSEVEKLHTAWTQKGRKFLYHTLKRRGVLPLAEQGG